jgi:hypothetical protein
MAGGWRGAAPFPSARCACVTVREGPECLRTTTSFYCACDHLHFAAAGRVAPHRFIEKVPDMTKIVAPPSAMSMADRVTYGIVIGVIVLGVLAFVFLQ